MPQTLYNWFFSFISLLFPSLLSPYAPRHGPISQSVTLELEGVTLTTTIDSETNAHHVECDLRGEDIALTQSANPYRIKSHRAACEARIARAAAKKATTTLTIPDTQPVASGSGSSNSTDWPGSGITPQRHLPEAEDCLFPESGSRGEVCSSCKQLPDIAVFVKLKERAVEVKEHTPWDYLTPRQLQALVAKLTDEVNRLRTKLNNAEVSGKRLQQKNSDYSRIMFLLSNNEFAGLLRTLNAALKRGASAKMILHILERALAGLYRPRGGFNKRELDI
ncbi:hypothetical protein B0H10DRAFT_1960794 [Mycena sp. CBHHK59/15]|nr:hypothetical protein B0H10DRAFT_1960794 [Mycena sp. CBHHK59/15]